MNTYTKILLASAICAIATNAVAGGLTDFDYDDYRGQVVEEDEDERVVRKIKIEVEEEDEDELEPYWEVIGMGGFAGLDSEDPKIHVTDLETDKLVDNDSWEAWSVQLGVGYVLPIFDAEDSEELQWFPEIEPQFNVYYLGGEMEGDVHRFENADYADQQSYEMNVESTRFMFDVGLTIASWEDFSIYGLAGLGVAINRVDLTTHDKCEGAFEEYGFEGKNDAGFAYEFGGGITYDVTERLGISAEYLYAGLGAAQFGDNKDEESDVRALDDFELTSQTVFLGFRYAL